MHFGSRVLRRHQRDDCCGQGWYDCEAIFEPETPNRRCLNMFWIYMLPHHSLCICIRLRGGFLKLFVDSFDSLLEVLQAFLESILCFVDFHFYFSVVIMRIRHCELDGVVDLVHATTEFLTQYRNIDGQTGLCTAKVGSTLADSCKSDTRILSGAFPSSTWSIRWLLYLEKSVPKELGSWLFLDSSIFASVIYLISFSISAVWIWSWVSIFLGMCATFDDSFLQSGLVPFQICRLWRRFLSRFDFF